MGGIDGVLLDFTERVCRRFQVLTGRTNVWLAVQVTNLSIVVYFVWAGVYFWSADVGRRMLLGLSGVALLYVLTQTVLKVPIEAYENSAYRRVAKGLRNPRRVRDAALRVSFLTLSVVLVYPIVLLYINPLEVNPLAGKFRVHVAVLSYCLIVLTTVVLYVLACDPLPPCTGKIRVWLRGASPAHLPSQESAEAPEGSRLSALGFSQSPDPRA
jgi:hypothetical protein